MRILIYYHNNIKKASKILQNKEKGMKKLCAFNRRSGKLRLIVHETYQGKCKSEDVFAAAFLSTEIDELKEKMVYDITGVCHL